MSVAPPDLSREIAVSSTHVERPAPLRVLTLRRDQVDADVLRKWRDLANRSCHHNAFLLPEFVTSSWHHLDPREDDVLLVVEEPSYGRWLAAGAFHLYQATRKLAVPHALASRCRHTYRTGLLLDNELRREALDALLKYLAAQGNLLQGLEFPLMRLDSVLAHELEQAALRNGQFWEAIPERESPAVFPELISEGYLEQHWSKNRRKSLRRHKRMLAELGEVRLEFRETPAQVSSSIEMFFHLENLGYKSTEKTSCKAQARDRRFVRLMVMDLAREGNVLMTELTCGGRVVASAINLIAGTTLQAFKIGWDLEFAKAGPGVLHEAELLLSAPEHLGRYTILDSCSSADSYLGPIWPERVPVGTGILCSTLMARWTRQFCSGAKWIKKSISPWL